MKTIYFALILGLILLIYSSVNYYVLRRALQAFPDNQTLKIWFIFFFILIASSFIAGRFLEKPLNTDFTYYLIWIASFWLAAILYFFLIVLVLDLLRLSNQWFAYFPDFITQNWQKTKMITLISSFSLVLILLTAGYLNNFFPKMVSLTFKVPQKESNLKQLKILLATDIHLGISITNKQINNLIEKVNSENPDIILLAGDILDEDPRYLIKNKLGNPLTKLKAKYGVWGITGNHEYIGGINPAIEYIESLGIKLLRDESVLIDNSFNLVGREDLSMKSFTKRKRLELDEILSKVDFNYPTIMMDHQPFKLKDVAQYPVDLQLSGHTHHGQLFPFNFITKAIYEKSWGYLKINKTHFYVSAGYGIWGPPIRTVSRPEIIIINLEFI